MNFKEHLEVAKQLTNSVLIKNLQSSGCVSVTYRGVTAELLKGLKCHTKKSTDPQ